MTRPDPRLGAARLLIDRLDAGILALAAARRLAVRAAARAKPRGSGRDAQREAQVLRHAGDVAADLGLPDATARQLVEVLVGDACRLQGLPVDPFAASPIHHEASPPMTLLQRIAARLPPPRALQPLLRRLPTRWHAPAFERAMRAALAAPCAAGELGFLEGRTLAIEVTDLGLRWPVGLREARLCVVDTDAEASVHGTLTDLLLLASRAEDADSLFFQRRIQLTGDTELGLLARNTLDRLDWERIPLGLRVLMQRSARWARTSRSAWRERKAARQARGKVAAPGPPSQ